MVYAAQAGIELSSTHSKCASRQYCMLLVGYPELIRTIITRVIGVIMLNCNKFIIM